MNYEWDEDKRLSNIEKHGVDFTSVSTFDWETAVIAPDARSGEQRHVAYGYIDSRLYIVVYTRMEANRRIISMRRANLREIRYYAEA